MTVLRRSQTGRVRRSAFARCPAALLASMLALASGCGLEPEPNPGFIDRDEKLQAIIEQVVTETLAPGYARLAASAAALPPAAASFCADRTPTKLEGLRDGWRAAMDDWQRVQLSETYGPSVTVASTIQFFPETSIPVAQAVEDHLAGPDPVDLATIITKRKTIQGLPALEYLIFAPSGAVLDAFPSTPDGDRRCELVESIARNLDIIAAELDRAWREEWIDLFVTARDGNAEFDDDRDAMSAILNGVLQLLEKVGDQKIDEPRGADAATSRPQRLESWRSRTSLRHIHANLESIETLYLGSLNAGMAAFLASDIRTASADAQVRAAFEAALNATRSIPVPLYDALTLPEERPWIDATWDRIGELRTLFEEDVSPALESRTVFNSSDGD
jgi:predicted lipoprotein